MAEIQSLKPQNLLFSSFYCLPKKTAPILVLPPLSHSQDTLSSPKLHLPLWLASCSFPLLSFHSFLFLPLSYSHTLLFSGDINYNEEQTMALIALALQGVFSKRWAWWSVRITLHHDLSLISATMLGLIALILHHLLPQHMSHTQSSDCVISIDAGTVCVCVCGMTSNDIRIWTQRKLI